MRRLRPVILLLGLAASARPDPQLDQAVAALRSDGSLKVRAQAAIVLGQRGDPAAAPALREAIARDEAAAVRMAAMGALARLGPRCARRALTAASQADPDGAVRRAAARALDGLGPLRLSLEESGGTPAARATVREALSRHLRDQGFAVADEGELRLRPTVNLQVSEAGGRTSVSVKASLVAVDAEGRVDMLQGAARATLTGRASEAALAGAAGKAVDAVARGLSEDLAARLGRR
jgi:hypothetical protein